MENKTVSEGKEAVIVLTSTVGSTISGFIAAVPIPVEWKAPILALSAGITGAIIVYWYAKINKP